MNLMLDRFGSVVSARQTTRESQRDDNVKDSIMTCSDDDDEELEFE